MTTPAYFFTDHFRSQLALNQAIMDNQKVKLVLFRYAPALGSVNAAWTAAKTVAELVASGPGWVEVSGVDGYPLDYELDVGTLVPPVPNNLSRYVMFNTAYPFAELTELAEVQAIAVVRVASLGGVTNPLIFVTNTPVDGVTNIASGDSLTASPDSVLPPATNRWMFSWAIPKPISGTVANTADLLTYPYNDVLLEPFNNFTAAQWANVTSASIVAGRTGTACQTNANNSQLDFRIPVARESDWITFGYAWRSSFLAADNYMVRLLTDAGASSHLSFRTGGGTQEIYVALGPAANVAIGNTVGAGIIVNTWHYIEVQARFHDTAGRVIVRVNGVQRLNYTGDTRWSPVTKATFDTFRILGTLGANQQFDDLYITTGPGAPFKGSITIP